MDYLISLCQKEFLMENKNITNTMSKLPIINRFNIKDNINKIISGGQTGVDRAALDVALKYNIRHGGWCPKGRLSENGKIPLFYNLQETCSSEYSERTKQNIIDSDATLIIVPKLPLPIEITDGTLLTIEICKKLNKLYLVIDVTIDDENSINDIKAWIVDNNIKLLNIAGPRESQSNNIYFSAYEYITKLIRLSD